jgi:hypothetical protein
MLREVKQLHGAVLYARDGEIGKVDEILFDDAQWTVRYLVVDTGGWLTGRKVLIPPIALGVLDWDRHLLNVNLTRDQVEQSPPAETDKPVSRQWETDYHDYYLWPYYWGGMGGFVGTMGGLSGGMELSVAQVASAEGEARSPQQEAEKRARDKGDVHLRSTKEVTGYGIVALDGHLGHVDDFIIDDKTWVIRYLAVDTRDWWPGKKVLLPPDWIGPTLWPERTVALAVKVTRDQVRNGPEWHPHDPISPAFEAELSDYYARQRAGTPPVTPGGSPGLGKV